MPGLPPRDLPVTVPTILGVNKKNILNFSVEGGQSGASFTFNFVLADGDPTVIAENSYISIIPGVFGFVDDVVYNVTTGGRNYTVTGRVFSPDMYKVISRWYVTGEQFKSIGKIPHVSQPQDAVKTGPTKIVPSLTFLSLIQSICQDNGIAYRVTGSVLDYKIFSFFLDGSAELSSVLQSLALQAGCNLVVRPDEFVFIPWGGNAGVFTVGADQHTLDLKTSTDTFPFKNLVLTGSDEPTPWNSFYIGLPEKIASINFEAGPISVKDISYGSGVVQASKDWIFPEDGINNWVTFDITFTDTGTAGNPIQNKIGPSLGVSDIWDYSYLGSNEVDYRSMFQSLKSLSKTTSVNMSSFANDFKNSTARYKGLVSWRNAFSIAANSDDIFPLIYVLPSDIAPDYPSKDVFDFQDGQALTLSKTNAQSSIAGSADFYQRASAISGVPLPPEFANITPDGYGFTCHDSDGNVGFNPDGSFVVPLTFTAARTLKKKMDNPSVMFKTYIDKGVYTSLFTGAVFVQGKPHVVCTYNDFLESGSSSGSLAEHLQAVKQRILAASVMPGRRSDATSIPIDGATDLSGDIGYRVETTTDQDAFRPENVFDSNTYQIVDIVPMLDDDGAVLPDKAVIYIRPPSRVNHSGQFTFYREHNTLPTSPAVVKRSSTASYSFFADSGSVAENSETLRGSWSLYGVKRRSFSTKIANGRPYYFGVSDDLDQENNQVISNIVDKFTKNASAQNVTWCVGTNSDLKRLSDRMAAYMDSVFKRSTRTYLPADVTFPLVGASCRDGLIVSYSLQVNTSGVFTTVNCGALPIL